MEKNVDCWLPGSGIYIMYAFLNSARGDIHMASHIQLLYEKLIFNMLHLKGNGREQEDAQ
jgi:hypothetical protein